MALGAANTDEGRQHKRTGERLGLRQVLHLRRYQSETVSAPYRSIPTVEEKLPESGRCQSSANRRISPGPISTPPTDSQLWARDLGSSRLVLWSPRVATQRTYPAALYIPLLLYL